MIALGIDFLNRRPRASLLGWALMLAGAASMAVASMDYMQAQDDLKTVTARAERQTRGSSPARARAVAPPSPELVRVSARAGTAIAQPWGRLLRELETLSDDEVVLLGVEAQGASHTLRLTGEGKNMSDVVDYVERLRELSLTRSAVLGSHELRHSEGVEVIRFSVEMAWGVPS